ncbi:hypothetical protein IWW37_002544 [Coemansia sp. RSA 2050]|nr:hypothetical protein IWW37_002544 [Coemansia sp. RSA 2050]
MAPPSRFQTLPMLIVELVVEYLEERARTSLDGAIDKHNTGETNQQNRGLCNVLVSELCKGGVSRVEMDSAPGCSLPSFQLPGVSGLTGLIQGTGQVCAPFARIAYLNASTLKKLVLRSTTKTDWLALIYGDSKAPVVYASLTSLILKLDDIPRHTTWAKIEDVALFPTLVQLSIHGIYPFEDDLLYRGNGGSLQSLRTPFRVVSGNIMGSYDVFKRSGVTRMNMIELDTVTDVDNLIIAEQGNTAIKQQIDCMLLVVTQLRLANDTPDMQLFKAIKMAPRTAVLEHLMFCNLPFNTDNIIEVISALPSLVSLGCRLKRYFTNVKALPANKQPSVLHERHYPLSSNFRKLVIIADEDDASAKQVAVVAMQLAVMCPKLAFVDMPPDMRKVFRREIAWAMANQPFKPYADSLRRLV